MGVFSLPGLQPQCGEERIQPMGIEGPQNGESRALLGFRSSIKSYGEISVSKHYIVFIRQSFYSKNVYNQKDCIMLELKRCTPPPRRHSIY